MGKNNRALSYSVEPNVAKKEMLDAKKSHQCEKDGFQTPIYYYAYMRIALARLICQKHCGRNLN